MRIVLVEGESDAVAVQTLAARLDMPVPRVLSVGGSKGARRAAQKLDGQELLGLVDAAERRDFEGVLRTVFVCDPDLEVEFIRALGPLGVESVIAGQGGVGILPPAASAALPARPAIGTPADQILWRTQRQQGALRAPVSAGGAAGRDPCSAGGPAGTS